VGHLAGRLNALRRGQGESGTLILMALTMANFGISSALLGVAWPTMRGTFGVSLDAVGVLFATSTAGFMLGGMVGGPITARLGTGSLMAVSSVVRTAGVAGLALAPSWWTMALAGVFNGLGAGGLEVGMNNHLATHHGAGPMNWLHATYGIGATAGPLLMTAILTRGISWRWGYGVVTVMQALLMVYYIAAAGRIGGAAVDPEDGDPAARQASMGQTLLRPIAWMGIMLFVFYTGVEVSGGQWIYPLFTEARAISPQVAGVWVSVYWGALTAMRLLAGAVANRIDTDTLLRACMLIVVAGAGLLWWDVVPAVSFAGVALMGAALAPIYPTLMSITPERVGKAHAANVIGLQTAFAGVGAAGLPALAGVLAESMGLEIVGPFLLAAGGVLFLLHEAAIWQAARSTGAP
jgi:fucose permease